MPAASSGPAASTALPAKGCRVVYENYPRAGATGRFSFTASSPTAAAAAAEAQAASNRRAKVAAAATAAAAAVTGEPEQTVSDADMAKAFMRGPAAAAAALGGEAGIERKKARTK